MAELSSLLDLVANMAGVITKIQNAADPLNAAMQSYATRVRTADRASEDFAAAQQKAAIAAKEAALAAQKATASGKPEDALKAEKAGLGAQTASQAAARKGEDAQTAKTAVGAEPGGGLAGLGASLGAIAGPAMAMVGIVEQVGAKLGEFVQAISPGTMEQFNRALNDLKATVGQAFEPIFAIFTGTFRDMAGIIDGVMGSLRPIIEQLANVMSGNLITTVEMLASVFEALMPFIQLVVDLYEILNSMLKPVITMAIMFIQLLLMPIQILIAILQPVIAALKVLGAIFEGVNEILKAVMTVMQVLIEAIVGFYKSLFAVDVKDTMKTLKDSIQQVVKAFYIFIAQILKGFGMDTALDSLIKRLEPKVGQAAAANSPSLKSFEQISNDLATSSFVASGTASEEKDKTNKDIVDAIKEIRDGKGTSTIVSNLEAIKKAVEAIAAIPQAFSREKFNKDAKILGNILFPGRG